MASRETATRRVARPAGRLATNLHIVRWAALLFLVADSTDSVVGFVAPSAVVTRPSGLDVAQTMLGLVACAALLWGRWRVAAATTVALVVLMLVRHPVGIELNLLIVAAASLAVTLRHRAVAVSLAGCIAFAAALGYSMHRDRGTDWLLVTLVASVVAALATAAGVVVRRLLHEREEAHRTLRRVGEENARIRAAERRGLATELQGILTHDFSAMRTTVQAPSRSWDAGELRAALARVGDQSRATLASVRVALHALRADLAGERAPAIRAPAWIDALHSSWFRRLLGVACVTLAALALGHASAVGATEVAAGSRILPAAVAAASALTVVVAMWRLRVGLAAAVVVLATGLGESQPSLWVVIPMALLCFAAAREGRWYWIATAVLAQLTYMGVHLARHGRSADTLVGALELAGIGSVLLGLTVGHFERERRSTRAELEQLHTQQGRIAAEERAGVARELHDVVGHQLSLVSLQAMAAEQQHDATQLRALLHRIQTALEIGESEIDELVGALHSPTAHDADGPQLTPTVVAAELSRQLQGHDYRARFSIDPRVDDLDPTTQRTVARILQESGTNVLRHAPSGADCSFSATLEEDGLTFLARSPLPSAAPPPNLSGGYGLRGIRERVDLTGGTFFAGSRDGAWEVQVSIRAQVDAGGDRSGDRSASTATVGPRPSA